MPQTVLGWFHSLHSQPVSLKASAAAAAAACYGVWMKLLCFRSELLHLTVWKKTPRLVGREELKPLSGGNKHLTSAMKSCCEEWTLSTLQLSHCSSASSSADCFRGQKCINPLNPSSWFRSHLTLCGLDFTCSIEVLHLYGNITITARKTCSCV